jgi:hypothetical protein
MLETPVKPRATRPEPRAEPPEPRSQPSRSTLDPDALADLARNPVARAHQRDLPDRASGSASLAGRALLFGLVLPGLVFLAASPIGWVLLLLGALAVFSFSSVTAM